MKEKLIFVYYSAKGFERHGEYGAPEIRVFLAENYGGYTTFTETLVICGQVDVRTRFPYALRFTLREDRTLAVGTKLLASISKAIERRECYGYRGILKMLKKLKIERYIHSGWVSGYTGKHSDFVPYAHRKNIDLWVEASKKGLKLVG